MVVQHNLNAANTERQYGIVGGVLKKSTEKLSSGYRINRAADDAAGLAISEKMRSQIRGLDKGETNSMDGISLLQIADGALAESTNMLHRINELAIQSSNDTNTEIDRQALQDEVSELLLELNRISETTEFNTQKVFSQKNAELFKKDPSAFIKDIKRTSFSINDKNIFFASSLTVGTNTISADDEGITMAGQKVKWDDTDFNSVRNSGGIVSVVFDNIGAEINLELAAGATTTGASQMLNGATFDMAYSDRLSVDVGPIKNVSSHFSIVGNYNWTFENDTTNDRFTKDIASSKGVSLDEKPVSIPIDKDFTIYVNDGQAEIQFGGTKVWGTYNINEFKNYINGRSVIPAGESIPLTYAWHKSGPDTSFFTMSVVSDIDLEVDEEMYTSGHNIFKNLSDDPYAFDEDFSIHVNGIYSDVEISGINLKEKNRPDGDSEDNDRRWWIQTSGQMLEGLFINTGCVDIDTLGLRYVDISTYDGAQDGIDSVRDALQIVTSERARIGAQQNRLEHTCVIIQNTSENTSAAESRIRDTDMASEMVVYSKNSILQQAGQSVLTQANQSTQGVLSIIGA